MLLVSNGHGEDAVGARIAAALRARAPRLRLLAMATVGPGEAYRSGPASPIGPRRPLPSGGMTVRRAEHLWADLRAGFVGLTWQQFVTLRRQRVDAVVAVGDVWAETLGLLPRARARFCVQTLVSARMAPAGLGLRAFREGFTVFERTLMRRGYRAVYVRDPESEAWLRAHGVVNVRAAGNPMMDGLASAPLELGGDRPRIALLPGSRGFASHAFLRMAEALARLPTVTAVMVWPHGTHLPPDPPGWRPVEGRLGARSWRRGSRRVHLARGELPAVLAWAELVLGTAGTAQEQAAGLGLPVVSFPLGGAYPRRFLRTQRRVIGEALEIVSEGPDAVAEALWRLHLDPAERRRRGAVGRVRMGPAGGAATIAHEVLGVTFAADATRDASQVGSPSGGRR